MTIPITATFIDEITHDIPSQNWGKEEWETDFKAMKSVGIDTVVLIRCGYRKIISYPSEILKHEIGALEVTDDLVDLFLDLAEKNNMAFYFGTYDSGVFWSGDQPEKEIELGIKIIDEVWQRYGQHPAFKGWYISHEVSINKHGILDIYRRLGVHIKEISGGMPILISPYFNGIKTVGVQDRHKITSITPEEHEKEWDKILCEIKDTIDIVAFQDGLVDFDELPEFLSVNQKLLAKHGLRHWSNIETFDRDIPYSLPTIDWRKLQWKLQAAAQVGVEKNITFEFSHFMSPNSTCPAAQNLYKRYQEYLRSIK